MGKQLRVWTTEEEINFIKNVLGKVRPKEQQKLPRLDLIWSYWKGCSQRTTWDILDQKKIYNAVVDEMVKESTLMEKAKKKEKARKEKFLNECHQLG